VVEGDIGIEAHHRSLGTWRPPRRQSGSRPVNRTPMCLFSLVRLVDGSPAESLAGNNLSDPDAVALPHILRFAVSDGLEALGFRKNVEPADRFQGLDLGFFSHDKCLLPGNERGSRGRLPRETAGRFFVRDDLETRACQAKP
jgi:hypothetical protein